jgi:NtrC-family two-component system sensor histidine kinase KinB
MLEQREEFMATLTHDLRNPLVGANRILELLAGSHVGPVSEEQQELLLQLRDNNRILLMMIQNLIEEFRFEQNIEAFRFVNTDMLDVLSSCLSEIKFIAKFRGIEIETDMPEKLPVIIADPNAIRRLVQNLLDNALKFTPPGGKIHVAVHMDQTDLSVEITDSGPGVASLEIERLFKHFSQGANGRKYTAGTGLGLYLCKQVVDAHHGKIAYKTAHATGATFIVSLPLERAG